MFIKMMVPADLSHVFYSEFSELCEEYGVSMEVSNEPVINQDEKAVIKMHWEVLEKKLTGLK